MAGYHTRMMMAVDDYLVYMKNERNGWLDDGNERRAGRSTDKIERLEKIREELDYLF